VIKNERQYRITKAQAEKFDQALRDLQEGTENSKVPSALIAAQADALHSQLEDLRSEIREYELLSAGEISAFELDTLEQLPRALIRARIASGLSQKELAHRLGLKEQQIQRYEATDYSGANLSRINEIVGALGIKLRKGLGLLFSSLSLSSFMERLTEAGLERMFVLNRLLPSSLSGQLVEDSSKGRPVEALIIQCAGIVGRVYDWTVEEILGTEPLSISSAALGAVQFKRPAVFDKRRLLAYTVYARHLAHLMLSALPETEPKDIPTDPAIVRKDVLNSYGSITFEHLLRYAWDLGIVVFPLADPGAFHGACFRVEGRSFVVLKQKTSSEARWITDLLHEIFHLGGHQSEREFGLVDADDMPGGTGLAAEEEEKDAMWFAADVALEGRAEDLAHECARLCDFDLRRMKKAVQQVAARENVRVDLLANYMAHRLSLENQDWWGAAQNLQKSDLKPWIAARNVLFERLAFSRLREIDRELITSAFQESEVE